MVLEHGGARSGSRTPAAIILGLALAASAAIWSATFLRAKELDNTMAVTGSARQLVTSDIVKWTGSFSRTTGVGDLGAANSAMLSDLTKVLAFLRERGIDESKLIVSPVLVEPIWGGSDGGPQRYTLRQNVELQSSDIAGVTQLAKDASSLMSDGVFFSTSRLEYYYSKLAELRIQMLAGAISDARTRASTIAESAGARLGKLRSASAGVTQVLRVNSMDISDYGAYDTSTIEKEVVATVRASFVLQ